MNIKSIIFVAMMACSSSIFAEPVTMKFNMYNTKSINKKNYPSELKYFPGSATATLTVALDPETRIYSLYMNDGKSKTKFEVVYDAESTKSERIAWDNKKLNSYKASNGDYFYVVNATFKNLVDRKKYFYDGGIGIYWLKTGAGTITTYMR